jgi:hypothetical protein
METFEPTLETLFEQLGLESSQAAIEAFVAAHPLEHDVSIVDAPFWSDAQRQLLQEALENDDEWAVPVDELNALLHEAAEN